MTKNVTFHDLFSDLASIKHDFYRRGLKLSETNHIKNMNVYMTVYRKIKRFISEIALYKAIFYISLLSMCQKRSQNYYIVQFRMIGSFGNSFLLSIFELE